MVTRAAPKPVAPQRLTMSYEDYLAFATEETIVEWVDGEVIIYMPPKPKHQQLVFFLSQVMSSFIEFFDLGQVLIAPLEVKLWPDGPSREPDIIFIESNTTQAQLTPDRLEGAPEMVVEVISPSSVTEDRVRKFTEYERAGINEYWLIDPRVGQQQGDFYRLGPDKRYQAAPLGDEGRYYSDIIPNFWLDLDWLWQEPLPNPQLALAEIMLSLEALSPEVKDAYQILYTKMKA